MSKLSKLLKTLTVGTALTGMMATGTIGLMAPQDVHASEEGKRNTLLGVLGGVLALGVYNHYRGGNNNAPAIDPSCAQSYTTTTNSGSYYNQSTTQSVNCPGRSVNYAPQQQQQIIVQPQRSSAEIQADMMRAEELAAQRQMRAFERDAEFYKNVGRVRQEQALNFCMNVSDPKFLDADNRAHCPGVLNNTQEGRQYLASIGRGDLLTEFSKAKISSGASDQCMTETVKETLGADGKVTGRTIERTTKPCKLQ